MREGSCINKSLLTLGKVISALSDQKKNQFVPYRDSVLTWLLRVRKLRRKLSYLYAGYNFPANTHLEETLSTLRYACQARSIVNRARINENPHDRMIRELQSEVVRLRALRQDYERKSFNSSSILLINDSNSEELEELRSKLVETEKRLTEAQETWEQRYLEAKRIQMEELAEAERQKTELESAEDVLLEEDSRLCENDILDDIKNWCCDKGLICTFNSDSLIITDPINKRQSFLLLNKLNLSSFENISDFINGLTWMEIKKSAKKLSKVEIMSSMNQIYQALAVLQPSDNENNLSLLFARYNSCFSICLRTSIRSLVSSISSSLSELSLLVSDVTLLVSELDSDSDAEKHLCLPEKGIYLIQILIVVLELVSLLPVVCSVAMVLAFLAVESSAEYRAAFPVYGFAKRHLLPLQMALAQLNPCLLGAPDLG
ncbi:hypothetical protein NQ317_005875 [Molorchus minor]|uniref:Kinesin motor domain-containing protein n=1 Tax=Molorchus minor TaxID=1323400 RepID=A0ABQ9JYH0_9CUCU|nr:hypothetical protein NQ317_005875 [Molorchus minor]